MAACLVATPDAGATVSVPNGAVSLLVTIVGGLTLPYQAIPSPNWATDTLVTDKTAVGFTLTFTTPAPPDAAVDLTIFQDEMGMRCR